MSTVRIQVRRGTASQWTSVNPILAAGEMGVESDTNLFKFGNGSSTWTALAYANNSDVAIGEISQDAINNALVMGPGLTKSYNDGANTITISVSDAYFVEAAQDAVNDAVTAGEGITKSYNDTTNTLTIAADTAVLATKDYVAAQRTSIQNTSDAAYLFAADLGVANGVASLNANAKVPASQLDISDTIKNVMNNTIVPVRGLSTDYDATDGTLSVSTEITGQGSVVVSNNSGDNGITLSLSPIVDATTKLITPLVQADEVSTDALSATTADLGTLTISGNLTVNGTTTSVNSTNYTVEDPMLYIGEDNQSNTLDLGLVAAFNDGTYQHSGLVRDASDDVWRLFSGVTAEPGTTVDFTTYTKDGLEVGPLFADAAMIGDVTNAEIQRLSGVTSSIQTQIDSKLSTDAAASTYAPKSSPTLSNPTFTGVVTLPAHTITAAVIEDQTITDTQIANNAEIALTKISGLQSALTARAYVNSPTFTGTVSLPATTTIGTVSATEIGYLSGLTSDIQGQISTTNTNLTTQVNTLSTSITNNYNSLSGIITANKTAADTDIASLNTDLGSLETVVDTKAPIASPTFTGTITIPTLAVTGSATGITKTMVGLANVDNTADSAKPVSTATQTALDLKANLAGPTFTGTVTIPTLSVTNATGITKTMVGLGNVDNTSDANKPVSTATQTALDLKAPKAAPTFTGTLTAADVTISGNLTVSGTTTTVNTTNFTTSDPVIYLGEGNAANLVDIGFVGSYNDGTYAHQGLVKDSSDSKWKLFKGVTDEPTTTVNFSQGSLDDLAVNNLTAAGIVFSDGTQTRAGVPSKTTIATEVSSSTTLIAGEQDKFIPLSGAVIITLPATGYTDGQSIDFWQKTGTGAAFANTNGVIGTPGLKFRTTNSVVTAMKISTGWLVFGDLSA